MPICKHEEFLSFTKYKNRILGIDHGTKKIGVAITDSDLIIATPLTTISRVNQAKDFENLSSLIVNNSAVGLVVGWPLNMNGSKGPRCQSVETFIKKFLEYFDIPIFFQDERMSSQAVEKILIHQDMSRKKRLQNIDKHAACWILQSAIDSFPKKEY